VPGEDTWQSRDRFAECPDLSLGKDATALPSANLEALGKARISFQNSSIQNLFKHICLNIIQHFITKLIFQTNISCFNEKNYIISTTFSYISICMN
jgi:hypothetical protein